MNMLRVWLRNWLGISALEDEITIIQNNKQFCERENVDIPEHNFPPDSGHARPKQ